MSDERTVVMVDGQGNVVGSITFASSTFLEVLTQMMAAGCPFQFSGSFVRNPSQPPKMVEASIVPRPAALRRWAQPRERERDRTMKTTLTLGEYLDRNESVVVFAAGVGCPLGREYPAGCEGWEMPDFFLALHGTVDSDNCWSWDGEADVRDDRGNSVTKVTASVAPRQWADLVEDYNANC